MKTQVFVLLVGLLITGSALGTTISFTPENPLFIGPQLQTVQVIVDDVQDMLSLSLVVEFDPGVVSPVAVTPGPLLSGGSCNIFYQWINSDDFTNTIEVDAALLGCTTAGGGVLFEVTFAGVALGTSPLVITTGDMRDGQNNQIPLSTLAGALTYDPEISANLSFQPEAVLFEEDGTTEICLDIFDVQDFVSMTVEFGFDPAVITPVSVAGGPVLDNAGCTYFLDWINSENFVNTMEIDAALLGCSTAGDGPVVCITFQGVNYGESPLTWQLADIRNSNNETVLFTTTDGMVLYNSAVASDSKTMSGLKALYR